MSFIYSFPLDGINMNDMRVVERGQLQVVSSGAVNTPSATGSSSAATSSATSASSRASSSGASSSAATTVRTSASAASAAASSSAPASAGFKSVDSSLFGVAGVLFAGIVGGMAVLL